MDYHGLLLDFFWPSFKLSICGLPKMLELMYSQDRGQGPGLADCNAASMLPS